MKHLSFTALMIMVVAVGTARADISVDFIEVGSPESGTLESEFTGDIPDGFRAWQIVIDTETKWIGAELDLLLDEGSFYYDAFGQPNRSTPNAALFPVFPSSRFTTHFSGTNRDGDQRQTSSFAPNPVRGTPVRGKKDKTYAEQDIITTWFTPDPLTEAPGTHVIGLITVSNDAQGAFGNVLLKVTDPERATQIDPVTGEVTREADPFIFKGMVVDGAIIIPEPSTALLAILGLVGLLFGGARRRSRQA